MPALCTRAQIGSKRLSNGAYLTELDWRVNSLVDELAKGAARGDRLAFKQRNAVSELSALVAAVATWIGQVTRAANEMLDPRWSGVGKQRKLRDSEGIKAVIAARSSSKSTTIRPTQPKRSSKLYDLSGYPR